MWNDDVFTPTDDFIVCDVQNYNPIHVLMVKIYKLVFIWQTVQFLSDSTIDSFLKTLKQIFVLVNNYLQNEKLQEIIENMPQTLYKARKTVGINRDDFDKHVVCLRCDETYKYDESYVVRNGIYL